MAKPFKLIPGPRGLPVIGSVLDYSKFGKFRFDKNHIAKTKNYEKYGPVYKEKLGPAVNLVQIFDPEATATIFRADGKYPMRPPIPITLIAYKRDKFPLGLGSLNGEPWYYLRNCVQKLMMSPRAAAAYLEPQNKAADDFLHTIEVTCASKGDVQDFSELILKYTMESIGVVCFGVRLGCLSPDVPPDSVANQMFESSSKLFNAVQETTFAFPTYMFFRTRLYKQFAEAKSQCDSIARNYVNQALEIQSKGQGRQPNAHNTDTMQDNKNNECPHFLNTLLAADRLHPEAVVGIITDLFTAGIDSTANALSFAIYNISRNPEAQEKLAQEVLSVLPKGSPVTAEAIDNMPYLKATLKESFRLNFPVEGGTTRILTKEVIVNGYTLPESTFIAFNNQTMCLQEKYFKNAKSFRPERWLKGGTSDMSPPPSFVMLPFGYGPRMCIGRRFAEQEIYLALIKLVQNYKMEYAGSEEVGMLNRVFTMPDRPIKVRFTPR